MTSDRQPPLLLDACVAINLAATDDMTSIVGATGRECLIVAPVGRELLSAGAPDRERRESLVNALGVATLAQAELRRYVQFALDLDDGEAATLAVASNRGWAVATDDRKARSIANGCVPPIALSSTPVLLHGWHASTRPGADRLRAALRAVEARACFRPRRDDPFAEWWVAAAS